MNVVLGPSEATLILRFRLTQTPSGYLLVSLNWKNNTLNVYYKRNMEKWRRPLNVWAFLAAPCTRRSRNIRLGRPES